MILFAWLLESLRRQLKREFPTATLANSVDVFWLGILSSYLLSGLSLVPFHADESTLVFMSRDYHYLVVVSSNVLYVNTA